MYNNSLAEGNIENIERKKRGKENDHKKARSTYDSPLPTLILGKERFNDNKHLIAHRNGLLIYLPNVNRRDTHGFGRFHSGPSLKQKSSSLDPTLLGGRGKCARMFTDYNNCDQRTRKKKKKPRRRRRRRRKVNRKRKKIDPLQRLTNPALPAQTKIPPAQPSLMFPPNTSATSSPGKLSPHRPLLKKRRKRLPRLKVTFRCDHGIDCLNRKRMNEYSLVDSKRNMYVHLSTNRVLYIESVHKFRSPQRYDEIRYELNILESHVQTLHPNIHSYIELIDDFSDDFVHLVYPSDKFFSVPPGTKSSKNPKSPKKQENQNISIRRSKNLMTLGNVRKLYQLEYSMIDSWNKQIISLLYFLYKHRQLVICDISVTNDFLVDTEEGKILFRGLSNLQFMEPETFDDFDFRNCEVNMLNIIGETLFFMCTGQIVEYDDYGNISWNIITTKKKNHHNQVEKQEQELMNGKKRIPEEFVKLIETTCNGDPGVSLEELEETYAQSSRERRREKKKREREKKRVLRNEVGRLEQILKRIDVAFRRS